MKKILEVVTRKTIEIDIADVLLTPAQLDEFSEEMWPVSSVEELFEHAAQQIARHESHKVLGLGMAMPVYEGQNTPIQFSIIKVRESATVLSDA